jgi:hypothetical protein
VFFPIAALHAAEISIDLKRREQKPESESLGYHLCESRFGPINEISRAGEHLDTTCGSPDTIGSRSDTVKYALGGAASMIGSQSGHS